ncbi:radical SAM protein [Ectothiorhodospiraceae bacterium BW-2]|nr:radical SAM protein [Ectothiorhodospiraceae bacterium BW-2]
MKIYEKIKIREHKQLLSAISSQEKAIPVHVRIEPTEICNLRCTFCWWHAPERRISLDNVNLNGRERLVNSRFLALIDELAEIGVRALSFTGAGDPLCHNGMEIILERVVSKRFYWGITSNMGLPLSDKMIELLAQAQWVRWSLNAGSSNGYQIVNRPRANGQKTFELACENIARLHRKRKEMNQGCVLTSSFIIHNNADEIVKAAELSSELGVDAIAYRPDTPYIRQETPARFSLAVQKAMEEAKYQFNSERFTVDICDIRLKDVVSFPPDVLCYYANHSTYIDARGDMYPCCYTRYDAKYVIGNVMDQSFDMLWWSQHRQDYFKQLSMRECPSCPHGRTNEVLKAHYDGCAEIDGRNEVLLPSDFFI